MWKERIDVVDLDKTGGWGRVEPLLRIAPWGQVAGRNIITKD